MANKRMINGSIWEDEFFTALSIFHRLLWVGIITQCADDQGRLRDSAALIRSNVFPLDDIKLEDIEMGITEFYKAGRIERYKANGKKLIQILNWWKHQTPRWAGASIYPAPDKWIDRERYHGVGNKMITVNWESEGGYIVDYKEDYTIPKVKDDINVNVKDEDDSTIGNFSLIQKTIEKLTGYLPSGKAGADAISEIENMQATIGDIKAGYQWLVDNGVNVKFYQKLVNPTRTAMSIRLQECAKTKSKYENVKVYDE